MVSPQPLVVFPLLALPERYEPCQWDLKVKPDLRAYWLELFRRHWDRLLAAYRAEAADRGEPETVTDRNTAAASSAFLGYLDQVAADPASVQTLNILEICYAREAALRAADIADPYRLAKSIDTMHAMAALPRLLAELDAMDEPQRRLALIQGIFAGNIYDLGATKTVEMFTEKRVDFHAVRDQLRPRPWRFDDLDPWLARLEGPAHRAACLFVDNAGPDVVLGMLPFARSLLQRGTEVILTANTEPSLNDITHAELVALLQEVCALDPVLARAWQGGRLICVASGNNAPLIDLRRVSDELAQTVVQRGVDLVVLEGMGRAVESNLHARLSCDTLKLAMLKDEGVAEALGTDLFDLVLRFEPALQ